MCLGETPGKDTMAALLFQSTGRQKKCVHHRIDHIKKISTSDKRRPYFDSSLYLYCGSKKVLDSGFLELYSRFQSQDSGFQKQRFPRFHTQKIPGSGSGQKVSKTTFDDINTTSHLFFCS